MHSILRSFRLVLASALVLSAVACGGEAAPADEPVADEPTEATTDEAATDEAATDEATTDEAATDEAAPAEAIAACPIERDLAPLAPCDCFGTVVNDTKVDFPDCTAPLKVVCCPGRREPICE